MAEYATALFLVFLVFVRMLGNHVRLRWIPGPWFAGLSDCWRWHIQRSSHYGHRLVELHEKYGRIVRLGPSCVSVSDVTLLGSSRHNGRLDELFSSDNGTSTPKYSKTGNISVDGIRKHPVCDRTEYLEGAAVYQGTIDRLVTKFIATIKAHKAVDLPLLLHYLGTDFVDILTMDDHVETNAGRQKLPADSYYPGPTSSLLSQSTMQYLALNNPRAKSRRRYCPLRNSKRVECCLTEDEQTMTPGPISFPKTDAPEHAAKLKLQCIIAGFVSTFYCLLKRPDIISSLKDEIERALNEGVLPEIPKWSELTRFRYLDAVMKEATRCCPFTAYFGQVKAPLGGIEISGNFLPEDTTIVCHPEIVRHSRHIYGSHPDTFNPERWTPVGEQQLATMDENLVAGEIPLYRCPKSYAAWMELKKATVLILRHLDLRLETENDGHDIQFDRYPPSAMVVII